MVSLKDKANLINYPAIIVELVNEIVKMEKSISNLNGRIANLESILGEESV